MFLHPTQFPQSDCLVADGLPRLKIETNKSKLECDGFDRWKLEKKMIDGR